MSDSLQGDVDFELWRTYFQLALEGAASSMSTPQSIVRTASEVATLACKRHAERLAELKGES